MKEIVLVLEGFDEGKAERLGCRALATCYLPIQLLGSIEGYEVRDTTPPLDKTKEAQSDYATKCYIELSRGWLKALNEIWTRKGIVLINPVLRYIKDEPNLIHIYNSIERYPYLRNTLNSESEVDLVVLSERPRLSP